MKLTNIRAEDWKMDGGAGFGLVPKTIWEKHYPADDKNCILMSSRLLLIEQDDRKILIDTGMGSKRVDKYYQFKYLQDSNNLVDSMKAAGVTPDQITDVIITHLHDDHVGGATYYDGEELKLYFANATHWVSKAQWNWAINPNKREAGTYFKDNFIPIEEAGKIKFVEEEGEYIPNIYFRIYNGHTMGNIIPVVTYNDKQIAYMGDFIPYVAALPLPFISATDVQPLLSLSEKEDFLNEASDNNIYLYFQHDYYNELCTVQRSSKRVVLKEIFKLKDII